MNSDILQIDENSTESLHAQLAESLRRGAASGRYKVGQRLPSIRGLADRLNLSPGTIQAAYRELEAEGLVESRPRSGIYLVKRPMFAKAAETKTFNGGEGGRSRMKGQAATPSFYLHRIEPNLRYHPLSEFCHLLAELAASDQSLGAYEDYRGAASLRLALAELFALDRIPADPENGILVTAGAQQAIALLARQHSGLRIAMEDPAYPGARLAFTAAGAEIVPLTSGASGFNAEAFEKTVKRTSIDLFYVCPGYGNPSGFSWSIDTRERVLRAAARHGVVIAEDDFLRDLNYTGENLPALAALAGRFKTDVVYIRTFSKCLLPALRIAGVAAAPERINRLLELKYAQDICGSSLLQRPLGVFLSSGSYQTHLEKARKAYHKVRQALRNTMPIEGLSLGDPPGGLCLLGHLDGGRDPERFLAECQNLGIWLADGCSYWTRPEEGKGFFRLSFGLLEADEAPVLAGLLREAAARAKRQSVGNIL